MANRICGTLSFSIDTIRRFVTYQYMRRLYAKLPFGQAAFINVYIRTPFHGLFATPSEIMPTLLTPDLEHDNERRASARVSYGAVLGVIEHNGTLPETAELRPVRALDLSHSGVSFTTTRWPSSDWLLIMMGTKDQPRYASARVVGCQGKVSEDDIRRFEVHCEFEQWLAPTIA